MARVKATVTKRSRTGAASGSRTVGQPPREIDSLRKALADFDHIVIAEPAVKPSKEVARAIRKAVREYYANLHVRERG